MAFTLTPKRLVPSAVDFLPDSQTALYTAGAGVTGVIETITIANTEAATPRTASLWIGGAADANLVLLDENINAGEQFHENRVRIVPPGATLYGVASIASKLCAFISGSELSGTPAAGEAYAMPTRLAQGFVVNGGDIVYTPASALVLGVVHTVTVINIDASPHDFILYSEFTASGRYFFKTLAAGERYVVPAGIHVVPFGSDLSASADADSVLVITVDGAEHISPA